MKTMGLIGGMSWESSIEYYRLINETVKERLGGLHSSKCLMYSVDFQVMVELMQAGDWERISFLLQEAAALLKAAGSDFVVICSNTMHRAVPDIEKNVGIPVHHIADAAAQSILKKDLKKVGLLGTKYAMEGEFYRKRLMDKFGLEAIIPDEGDRCTINRIIFDELCAGVINPASKEIFLTIIDKLIEEGAEGIILGCTEIPLLIKQEDVSIPIFDTMTLHAVSAVELALA